MITYKGINWDSLTTEVVVSRLDSRDVDDGFDHLVVVQTIARIKEA